MTDTAATAEGKVSQKMNEESLRVGTALGEGLVKNLQSVWKVDIRPSDEVFLVDAGGHRMTYTVRKPKGSEVWQVVFDYAGKRSTPSNQMKSGEWNWSWIVSQFIMSFIPALVAQGEASKTIDAILAEYKPLATTDFSLVRAHQIPNSLGKLAYVGSRDGEPVLIVQGLSHEQIRSILGEAGHKEKESKEKQVKA
jgi:hypothetical protein